MKTTIPALTVLTMIFLAGCGKPPATEQSNSTNAPAASPQSANPPDSDGMNTPPKTGDEMINNNPPVGTMTNPPAITNETDTNNPATTNQ